MILVEQPVTRVHYRCTILRVIPGRWVGIRVDRYNHWVTATGQGKVVAVAH